MVGSGSTPASYAQRSRTARPRWPPAAPRSSSRRPAGNARIRARSRSCEEPGISFQTYFSSALDTKPLGDRVAPAVAERACGDLGARRHLAPLVLVAVDPVRDVPREREGNAGPRGGPRDRKGELDERLDERVEDLVRRQGVRVRLVRAQLRGGRLLDRRSRDALASAVDLARPARRPSSWARPRGPRGRRPCRRRACSSRRASPTCCRSRARRWPDAVRERHEDGAADARLEVLLGDVGRRPPNDRLDRPAIRRRRSGSIGIVLKCDAEVLGEILARPRGFPARELRAGHRDAESRARRPRASAASAAVTAESMPPERPSTALRESALARVVASAEDERAAQPRRRRSFGRLLVASPPGQRRSSRSPPRSARRARRVARARRTRVEAPSKTSSSLPPTRLQWTRGSRGAARDLAHHAAAQAVLAERVGRGGDVDVEIERLAVRARRPDRWRRGAASRRSCRSRCPRRS